MAQFPGAREGEIQHREGSATPPKLRFAIELAQKPECPREFSSKLRSPQPDPTTTVPHQAPKSAGSTHQSPHSPATGANSTRVPEEPAQSPFAERPQSPLGRPDGRSPNLARPQIEPPKSECSIELPHKAPVPIESGAPSQLPPPNCRPPLAAELYPKTAGQQAAVSCRSKLEFWFELPRKAPYL